MNIDHVTAEVRLPVAQVRVYDSLERHPGSVFGMADEDSAEISRRLSDSPPEEPPSTADPVDAVCTIRWALSRL